IGLSMIQPSRCAGPDRAEVHTVVIVALTYSRVADRTRPRVLRTVIGAILSRSISRCQPLSRISSASSVKPPLAVHRVIVHFNERPAFPAVRSEHGSDPMTGAAGRPSTTAGARAARTGLSLGADRSDLG